MKPAKARFAMQAANGILAFTAAMCRPADYRAEG